MVSAEVGFDRGRWDKLPRWHSCRPCWQSDDVCGTACGEDNTIIMDTVAAAACQDYLMGRHRVFVLDDGQDDMLQSMVGALNERLSQGEHQQVVYFPPCKRKGGGVVL